MSDFKIELGKEQPLGREFTDAEWAADEAARALRAGRYKLAAAFARIADQANDLAEMRIPYQPTALTLGPLCPHGFYANGASCAWGCIDADGTTLTPPAEPAAGSGLGPTGRGDVDLAAAEAQTQIFGPVKDATAGVVPTPAPQRCRYQFVVHGAQDECRAGIYWHIGKIGDMRVAPGAAAWLHIDSRIDDDHRAVPHGSNSQA